jgi:hypothetical protein
VTELAHGKGANDRAAAAPFVAIPIGAYERQDSGSLS